MQLFGPFSGYLINILHTRTINKRILNNIVMFVNGQTLVEAFGHLSMYVATFHSIFWTLKYGYVYIASYLCWKRHTEAIMGWYVATVSLLKIWVACQKDIIGHQHGKLEVWTRPAVFHDMDTPETGSYLLSYWHGLMDHM